VAWVIVLALIAIGLAAIVLLGLGAIA